MPALALADNEGEGVRRDEAVLRLCRLTLPGPPYNEVDLANTQRQATKEGLEQNYPGPRPC